MHRGHQTFCDRQRFREEKMLKNDAAHGKNTPQQGSRESVWDYPRPPRVEQSNRHIRIIAGGKLLAETRRALRVLETSHPPSYYIPPADVKLDRLEPGRGRTLCEWKGFARYYTVLAGTRRIPNAAWYYPSPWQGYEILKDHIAFYPKLMDACYVDGEQVVPEPGSYYGGWITRDIVGPFRRAR
jgi:uncharacterized protein (DUF427 family)